MGQLLEYERAHRADQTLSVFAAVLPRDPAQRTAWYATLCREFGRIRHQVAAESPHQIAMYEASVDRFLDRIPRASRDLIGSSVVWFGAATGEDLLLPLDRPMPLAVSWGSGPSLCPEFLSTGDAAALRPASARA